VYGLSVTPAPEEENQGSRDDDHNAKHEGTEAPTAAGGVGTACGWTSGVAVGVDLLGLAGCRRVILG